MFINVLACLRAMLENSFVLLPGVKQRTEQKFWKQEMNSWSDFIAAQQIKGISEARKERFDWHLKDAKLHLKEENEKFFAQALPSGEQWRLFDEFKDQACYLDIETSGYYGDITVVGISDGVDAKTMVKGFNLDRQLLMKELSKYKMIVTFNGASFDLPVIKKYFDVKPTVPHVDLRFVCQKIGHVGGLKAIEKKLNIQRRKEVQDMSGEDAVYLWQMWKSTGNREHLDKLVWYNEEDILNLKPLAEKTIPELWKKIRS